MPDTNGDWTRWSMFLIEGIKSMRENIAELYQLVHDIDLHGAEERQRVIIEVTKELQQIRQDFQAEINRINIELTKVQIKMAFWSSLFASVGAIIGSIVVYAVRSWFTSGATGKP